MLLSHAATNKEELREEVLSSLCSCLKTDNECFNHWMEIHHSFLAQSNNLIVFILVNWNKKLYLQQKLSSEKLRETMEKIKQINRRVKGGELKVDATNKELEMCDKNCQQLLGKLKRSSPFKIWGTVIPLSILIGVTYWTSIHCCEISVCAQNEFVKEFIKC